MSKHFAIVLAAVTWGASACDAAETSSAPETLAAPDAAMSAKVPMIANQPAPTLQGSGASPSAAVDSRPRSSASGAAMPVTAGDGAHMTAGLGGAGAAAVGVNAGASGTMTASMTAGAPAAAMSGSAGEVAQGGVSTGSLPAVKDLEQMGPMTPTLDNGTGPDNGYRLDYPEELGADGMLHPLVLFAAGGGFPENYDTLLRYLASHGFVVLTYAATSEDGKGILDGLDWLVAQNEAQGSKLMGKLDTQHVAASGHSFGSLAAFNAASDPRLTTTVHLQGGTLSPHTAVANLRAPAQFICGETPTGDQDGTFSGDMANENCAIDFEMAEVPVFYGSLQGAAHIQLTEAVSDPQDPLRMRMLGAVGGWLRWWLAGDETQRARYVGSDCELCRPDSGWTVMQKGLE